MGQTHKKKTGPHCKAEKKKKKRSEPQVKIFFILTKFKKKCENHLGGQKCKKKKKIRTGIKTVKK